MFEQDRLQGRINQLFKRIEAQLRQVFVKRECVRVKVTPPMKPCWQAKSAFCEGMLSRFVRSDLNTARRMI
ncbi:hypothetical protein ACLK17_22460 [Escherichia coli]